MTPDEIAKLRALAGAATPGLWGLLDDARGTAVCAAHGSITICRFISPSRAALADARYIAAACNAVPRLCDEIERLRRLVEAAHRVAYRGEHTGDCIGASGGACFEDDRDECKCGLTALRNALKGSE